MVNKKVIILALICCIALVGTAFAEDLVKPTITTTIIIKPTVTVTQLKTTIVPTQIPTTIPVVSDNKASISIANSLSTIAIKPISATGVISKDPVDIKSFSKTSMSVASIEITDKDAKIKKKTIQLRPEAKVQVSDDAETVMQTANTPGNSKIEIYYGYQKSSMEPWQYYYRVDGENTIHADFNEHRVWVTKTDVAKVDEIIMSGQMPEWSELP